MSLKPPVITQDQLIEQVQNMDQQKQQLETSLELLKHKLQQIEHSLAENDHLRVKIQELLHHSFHLFENEWKRRTEYYPEIRLRILEKAIDLVVPK